MFGVFVLALALNFLIIAFNTRYEEGTTILALVRKLVVPVLSSELFAALLAVGVAYLYTAVGLAAIGLFGAVLFTFQHLLGQLLLSEQRADELERRGKQLIDQNASSSRRSRWECCRRCCARSTCGTA